MSTDRSTLDAPALAPFKAAAEHGRRVYVITRTGNTDHHRTGRIGRTTGTHPAYLIVHRSDQDGSWDLITEADSERTRIVATQHRDGRYYTANGERIHPGRNRFTDHTD